MEEKLVNPRNSKERFWWRMLVFVISALVILVGSLTLLNFRFNDSDSRIKSGSIDDEYGDVLNIAMQFFDIQRKEKLVNPRNIKERFWWRILVFVLSALVILAGSLTLWKKFSNFHINHSDSRINSGSIDEEYGDVLNVAMQFFDIQRSGRLVNNEISWRGDSGLFDGKEANLDLSKGMYDAGDLMKFGFPMAFTATILSWAILEYGDQMEKVNELKHAQDSVKWITDYLISAHPSDNVLYIQVGDAEVDHKCWQRPEETSEIRPLTQVNISYPGTDAAAETAAAMSAASLVFKTVDPAYSKILLNHSKQLFHFADTYRSSYSSSFPQVQEFYNSSGYSDELLWAASWLYLASDDVAYLGYVTQLYGNEFANWGSPSWFSWDNKLAGTHVLLSRLSFFGTQDITDTENLGLQMYRRTADAIMCELLPDSPTATSSRTSGGLIWVSEWNVLQYAVASAFLALVYSDYMRSSQTSNLYCAGKLYNSVDLRNFAIFQADYVLGNNPMSMSYLVGHGNNYPQYVHHRGASVPLDAKTGCTDGFMWLNTSDPNPYVAMGAIVGGPFLNETYIDSRNNSMQGEPTTYNSAFFVGLISGLLTTSSVVSSFG